MLNIQRVNHIVYEKVGPDKYKLAEPIQVLPTKKYLTEKELEIIYRVFDNGFKIKKESEEE